MGHHYLKGASMYEFFEYYHANPSRWQTIKFMGYDYLKIAALKPESFDSDFLQLLPSLADFANYIPNFKTKYRI